MRGKIKGYYITTLIIIVLVTLPILFFMRNYKATEENSAKILQQYYEIKNENDIYKQRDFVYENSKKLTVEDSTKLLEEYLTDLQIKSNKLYDYSQIIKKEIDIYDDMNLTNSYNEISNEIVSGLFKEAFQLDIQPMKINDRYIFMVNMNSLYKKISSTVKPDFKALSYMIADNVFFNLENIDCDIDVEKVIMRIDTLFNLKEQYKNSDYTDMIDDYLNKYVDLLFCVNNDIFLEDINSKLYKKSHLENIKKYLPSLTNSNLKNNINDVLVIIEKNNNYLNDDVLAQIEKLLIK